ncbi:FadR family transcriptional regulator [Rhodococcus sp. BP-252]|uniref:FadR/GntR family transcriptional regulator n=1 Tax=unclassified Rhodococcus (in: high G+C Gram-positive bacteria) TaxID=192944 RepID=UPI001C9A335E|nr:MULTISPECIES: FCD domain-containing protein [unclassified Rhodococcus (in: high G+C Gram-positive bacteria)]MBY6412857.1 FadR family transcriptional regulator [Rhodococcus sp. BP-320]MBY6417606.1 FadR family transcriptional regulator [Rhodococcus sp. BP-321]MBY6423458.1 FadR family transcriptional regulator [Rhodococcus sp. BP-324]MBY6427630.1 FadR family transcriptional regulator [Rhodococcus sp. BP-323]MBY6432794.1 FadR family transcriptional regulator [Rhodococcus sp. BP-322]
MEWSELEINDESIPDQLSGRIAALIDSGRLAPGGKFPSERSLMELVGASRISVRQALQDLELKGYLTRQPRIGRVVAPAEARSQEGSIFGAMSRSQRAIREVMDLRAVIEPPIAERAALRHKTSELARLRGPLEASERALDEGNYSDAFLQRCDVEFHLTIALLAHNPMLRKLVDETNAWMAPSRQRAFQTELRMRRSVDAHRLIYQAIADRDPRRAKNTMGRHIADVLRSIDPLTRIDE